MQSVANLVNIDLVSVGLAVVTSIILGSIVYFHNRRSVTARAFFWFTIVSSLWGGVNYSAVVVGDEGVVLWLVRATMFFALLQAFSFYVLSQVFPNESTKFSAFFRYFLVPLVVVVAAATFSPWVFTSVEIPGNTTVPTPIAGPAIPLFGLTAVGLVVAGILNLIKKYRRSDGKNKRLIRLFATGLSFMFIPIIVLNFIFTAVLNDSSYTPFGALFILPFVAFTSYSIFRLHFLDIKAVASEILVAVVLLISATELAFADDLREVALRSVGFVLLIFFGIYLIRSVLKEVSHREQLQKLTSQLRQTNSDLILRNRYLAALQALTNEITRSLDFKKFSQEIVDGVAEKLGFAGGILLTLNRDGETIELATMTNNRLFKKAVTFLPDVITSYTGNFKKDNTLTILAMRTGRVQIGSDLHSFISPPVPRGIALVIQNLLRIRSIMAVPIFSDNKVLGCLLVGSRSSKEQTANTEIQMVKALADEVGIVARNLILYERLEEANTKLKAANEQLERLDKAKTEFLSIASHQLRTPLTAIKGYVSMILEGDYGKIPSKFTEPLNDVFESAERLIALVNDLLDVSRIASGRMELHIQPVDLDKLTRDVIEEIMPKAEAKKIPLVLNNKMVKEALVQADPEKLRQVVINLIDNAIKYTEEGQVTITFEGTGSHIRFSVKDNGIGISAQELPQLFHKFMRAPEAKLVEAEGTGLGLYVAKTVVESMGGKIWAESEGLGKGSRFIFELPAASKELREKTIKVENKNDYI